MGLCKDLKGLKKLKNIKAGKVIFFSLIQLRHLQFLRREFMNLAPTGFVLVGNEESQVTVSVGGGCGVDLVHGRRGDPWPFSAFLSSKQ